MSTGRAGMRDVVVQRVHQLPDALVLGRVRVRARALQGLEAGAADDWDVVAGEALLGEQLAQLELDQVEELGVVHHVDLVEEDDDGGHFYLAGEQDVLARLGHGAVRRRNHQDGAVHLGRAGDHVLDVVGVAGAVDVGVVALVGLVLDVLDGDGDAARALFGSVVDAREVAIVRHLLQGEDLCDRGCERCLAMVNVADGAYVEVRLGALEFLLGHFVSPSSSVLPG